MDITVSSERLRLQISWRYSNYWSWPNWCGSMTSTNFSVQASKRWYHNHSAARNRLWYCSDRNSGVDLMRCIKHFKPEFGGQVTLTRPWKENGYTSKQTCCLGWIVQQDLSTFSPAACEPDVGRPALWQKYWLREHRKMAEPRNGNVSFKTGANDPRTRTIVIDTILPCLICSSLLQMADRRRLSLPFAINNIKGES